METVDCGLIEMLISVISFMSDSRVKVKNAIPPMRRPTHHRRVGRHIVDASADTLPTHWPTLPMRWSKYFPFLTIVVLFLSVGSKNNFIRKDENMIAK